MGQNIDAAAYYEYLFDEKKKPTKILDALLRGIANYIIDFIGDKETRCLTPPKLAAFYKAVGGNYDALFIDIPDHNISYIYQSIGCQHSLQPNVNDYKAPSIPALTIRGFVRWESIETLLGPEEHVPFLQAALQNFSIKHPDTGEPFPVNLPKEAFPLHPDPEIERWHQECSEELHRQAAPNEDYPTPKPTVPLRPKVRSGYYTHVRAPSPTGRPTREREDDDYFSSRPFTRHIPPRAPLRAHTSRESSYHTHLSPNDPSKSDDSPRSSRARRRSVPDNYYTASPVESPSEPNSPRPEVRPQSPGRIRRHSHPRHKRELSISSSSSSESDIEFHRGHIPVAPQSRTRPSRTYSKESPKLRFTGPPPTSPASSSSPTSSHRQRDKAVPYPRERPTTYKVPIDMSRKLSPPFMQPSRHKQPLGNDSRGSNETEDGSRDRQRDRVRRDERPRVVQVRSGSHDGRYRARETDRRDRDRDWDERSDRDSREEREYERRRARRRTPSPTKGSWRRFVPGLS